MKFRAEKHKEVLTVYQKIITDYKEKLANPKPESAILWEIGNEFESSDSVSNVDWLGDIRICIYINGSINEYVFESLLDELDEIVSYYDYHLNFIASKFDSWDNEYKYVYCKNEMEIYQSIYNIEDSYFIVSFKGNSCKSIETGKMIPETKQVCNMIN